MPLLTPHKLLPLMLLGSTLLIGGCSKDNAESRAAQAQQAAAAVLAPALPPLPKIDYWKPVASYLVGSYALLSTRPARYLSFTLRPASQMSRCCPVTGLDKYSYGYRGKTVWNRRPLTRSQHNMLDKQGFGRPR